MTGLIIFIGGIIGVLFSMIGIYYVDKHMAKKINLHNKKMRKENEDG
jgi:H+/gluconate symporter-like permease